MTDDSPRWTTVASFPGRFLAEVTIGSLEADDIPVLVKGEEPGIWGPGFTGLTPQGIQVLVPADYADRAREIITGLESGGEGPADWEAPEDD